MIRRLRRRMVLMSMLSFTVVLVIIVTGINIYCYSSVTRETDALLDILTVNGGAFPDSPDFDEWARFGLHYASRELPHETRFFCVTLTPEGEYDSAYMSHIIEVDEDEAALLAANAWNSGSGRGYAGDYRYVVHKSEDGYIRVIFVNCAKELIQNRMILRISIMILAGAIVVSLILSLLLTRRFIRPAEESYAKQRRFISDAGHEIKTPLTVISADAGMMEAELGENMWLTDIMKQTRRLSSLTKELIYLSGMDEKETERMIDFPVSELLEEQLASFEAMAILGGRSLSRDIQPGLSLRGNQGGTVKLIDILLDNALKYSDEGSAISVSLRLKKDRLTLTVSNACRDIDGEVVSNMFDRFYRSDSARSGENAGFGIGLAVAKEVMRVHHGRINAFIPAPGTVSVEAVFPGGKL